MKKDEYGEVLNSEETYKSIAVELKSGLTRSVLIGWTDGLQSHFDIMFTLRPTGFGHFQRGIRTSDLFVSIMSVGAFGFEITDRETHYGYYDEKFGRFFGEASSQQLADLINGVKRHLAL